MYDNEICKLEKKWLNSLFTFTTKLVQTEVTWDMSCRDVWTRTVAQYRLGWPSMLPTTAAMDGFFPSPAGGCVTSAPRKMTGCWNTEGLKHKRRDFVSQPCKWYLFSDVTTRNIQKKLPSDTNAYCSWFKSSSLSVYRINSAGLQ